CAVSERVAGVVPHPASQVKTNSSMAVPHRLVQRMTVSLNRTLANAQEHATRGPVTPGIAALPGACAESGRRLDRRARNRRAAGRELGVNTCPPYGRPYVAFSCDGTPGCQGSQ